MGSHGVTLQNTGDLAIASLSVTLNGIRTPITWNSTLPLLPGSTIAGSAPVNLQSAALVPGTTYPKVVTATFSDGAVVTQTASVQYTS